VLSIIIPAHNEAALIRDTVRAAARAAAAVGQPFEVIVADDASTDATADLAASAGATVVPVNRRQIAAVRNAGANAAHGDWLVFLDADTQFNPATLFAAAKAIRAGFVGGGAVVIFEPGARRFSRAAVVVWNFVARIKRWAAGSFLFVRADVFRDVCGFDERYYASEEIILSDAIKRRGPFAVVSPPVLTSARKERLYPWWIHFVLLWKVIVTRGAALQKRDGLDLWYDGRRETPQC
jgi:glycosyltransferase involved in cell wall biosynthesis